MDELGSARFTIEDSRTRAAHTVDRWDSSIEGLRAVAVLAVLLHHAAPTWLPGGFCGVDIFFVISGYLIGGKLISSARAGTLSFTTFYAARARRLFPALIVVLAATWAASAWKMTGPEFASLGRHILASAGFANNFLLAAESGYFDAPAATKPLLHLWSLGIEEQFYLAAPLLVWLGWRGRRHGSVWVLRLGAASLLWTLWFWDLGKASNFYHPAFRFWELATGVALAAWQIEGFGAMPARLRTEFRAWALAALLLVFLQLGAREWSTDRFSLATLTGLLLIAATVLLLIAPARKPPSTLPWYVGGCGFLLLAISLFAMPTRFWPGPQTAIPVLGTFLILASPGIHESFPILKSRVAVAIGGISYPLYLWHWPALVSLRHWQPQAGPGELLLVLLFSAGLAWLTKVGVEEPVRFGRFAARQVRRPPVWLLSAGLLLSATVGWVSHATGGLPQRFPPALRGIATWSEDDGYVKWRLRECYYHLNNPNDFAPHCSPPRNASAPTVLLWGDSHAAHLYLGLVDEAQRSRFQLAQWTMGSCPPTLRKIGNEQPACAARRAKSWRNLQTYVPDVVILSAAWSNYHRSGTDASELAEHIRETVAALRRLGVRHVLVVGNGQLWDAALPTELYRYMMARRFIDAVPERFGRAGADLWSLDRALQLASEASGVAYFSPLQALCDASGCRTIGDRTLTRPDLLYWDKDHLTPSGSRLVVGAARPVLLELVEEARRAAAEDPGSAR